MLPGKSQIRMNSPLCLALLSLLAAPLVAQSNATSSLMTYGDVLGQPFSAQMSGLTPNATTILIPSFLSTGSSYLVGQSGDANDMLAVGIDLAANGNYFTGTANALGTATFNLVLPNNPILLDRNIYWQGFTRPGSSGAALYQDFSNIRLMSGNQANRWQAMENRASLASANLAFTTWEVGELAGRPTKLFVCGGGPALLVDVATPYPTINRCWQVDSVSGHHTILPGVMNSGRAFHQVVKLQDGRFMAIGGIEGPYGSGNNHYTKVLNTCEIYNPVTGIWTATPNMGAYRAGCNAMVLADGRVYVAGGTSGNNAHEMHDVADLLGSAQKSTEFYNPATNTWSWGPNMTEFKAGASGLVLADGRWLVSGGITHTLLFGIPIPDFSANQQLYSPSTNSWANTGSMRDKRALGGITQLPNGNVYIAGGGGGDIFNIGPIRKTEIYNLATGVTTAKPNLTADAAFNITVTLADGRAMVVGGARGDLVDPIPLPNVWIYDDALGTLVSTTALPEAHAGGVVTVFEDGTVYCGGGESDAGVAVRTAVSHSL
jgi:N-acetylneuraminic acid mutarotase